MIIKNAVVFTAEGRFRKGELLVQDGRVVRFADPGTFTEGEVYDAKGQYVLPGFVDIHTHGCVNSDFCDADAGGLERMLQYYGQQGVTSVVPATMSFNEPILEDVLDVALPYFEQEGRGAVLRGVNMEGPFINLSKKGAQNPKYITDPDFEMFHNLYKKCSGRIRLVDIAPELPGSLEFTKKASELCTVSIAHTAANYQQAVDAFDAGATHVTHLFNAMPPFAHRDPGVIGAASDKAAHVEIISDGFHLHPSVVRSVFSWFGAQRVCLISDSMRATGMPDGEYSLGGQKVWMKGGKATLEDGTIAGSATNLAECCRRAIGFGIPMEQAIAAATANPANAAGLQKEVGSLAPGLRADIVVWDAALQTKAVFSAGQKITGD